MDLRRFETVDPGLGSRRISGTKQPILVEPQRLRPANATCAVHKTLGETVDQRNGTPPQRTGSPSTSSPEQSSGTGPAKGVIHQAAAILREQHQVSDMIAFEILVRGAADAGTSVREISHAVLEGHPSLADRMSPEFLEALSRQSVS
jgi:hypothetical protein